ncbi:MAG TPA: thiamine phosphate synthase [Verrucomicrobiae bacterium]|nr:thiamine phosphate synthase [Verrucomicrobiae bacterium]
MKPLQECRLYAFVDTSYLHGRRPQQIAAQLCAGGADLIQLRAKGASKDEVRQMAEAILPVTRRANVGLIINDHLDIAIETGADGCHLGQEDFFGGGHTRVSELFAGQAGKSFPNSKVRIGLSTHSPGQALEAHGAGADYLGIGPVYSTGTKPQAKPVTLQYVRWAAGHLLATIPWFAIGGIDLGNLDDVLAAGATRICVVSAILNAEDLTAACRAFKERLCFPKL